MALVADSASPAGLKPALFYGRVSKDDDESVDTQLLTCREIALSEGFYIPDGPLHCYGDDAVSGAVRHRNGLDQLLKNVTSGRVGAQGREAAATRLYIREKARAWRGVDPRFPNHLGYLLSEHGVDVRYCDNDRHVDYSQGVSDADIGVFISDMVDVVNASRERTRNSGKFRSKKRELVKRGFYPSPIAPYGMERILVDKETREFVQVVPRGVTVRMPGCRFMIRVAQDETADHLRFMYASIIAGKSLRWIVDDFKRRGVPSPTGNPGWDFSTISLIVANPINKGTLIWGRPRYAYRRDLKEVPVPHTEANITDRSVIIYEGFIPEPLVSAEEWEAANAVLRGNQALWEKRRACQPKYLLTGKLVCAQCGQLMWGYRPGNSKDPDRHPYYHHYKGHHARAQSCLHYGRSVRADALDGAVIERVRALLTGEGLQERLRAEIKRRMGGEELEKENRTAARIRKRLAKKQASLQRAAAAQLAASSDAHRRALEAEAARLGAGIDADNQDLLEVEERQARLATALANPPFQANEVETLLARFDTSSEDQRSLVERLVHSVRFDRGTGMTEIILHTF
jgi:hypothetical protein